MTEETLTLRRALPRVALCLLAVLLGACGSTPYVDARREAGKRISVGFSNADVVAICYGGGTPGPDVLKLAESTCAETGRTPQYVSRTRFACNLLTPSRIFFRCVKPGEPPPQAGS